MYLCVLWIPVLNDDDIQHVLGQKSRLT